MYTSRFTYALAAAFLLCSCDGSGAPKSQETTGTSAAVTPVPATPSLGLVLEVLDQEGTNVTVTQAETFFRDTSYSPPKYNRLFGIELKQGAGKVVVDWSRIEQVDLTSRPGEYGAPESVCILHLTNGKEVSSPCDGTQYVAGSTELGGYEVYLGDLKSVRVKSRPQLPAS